MLVATEAAGEGINLQFCSQMINYDIPWNPVRLEQRVGRIHRYGQEHDCIIFNFVARNTREGRVLQKLLERLREIRNELGTDQVFDVVGEIFPANLLEKLFRDLYARRTNEHAITDRIVRETDPTRFREITQSALEGLAKKELNLSAIVGKTVEAKEGRLVPEAIKDFFVVAAPETGIHPQEVGKDSHIYRVGKIPRTLIQRGNALEHRFGKLGREYGRDRFRQGIPQERPDPRMGHARTPALRGGPGRGPRPRPRPPQARGHLLRHPAEGPERSGRLRGLGQGRPGTDAPPPAFCG